MKKTLKKTLTGVLFLGVFFLGANLAAASAYDQADSDGISSHSIQAPFFFFTVDFSGVPTSEFSNMAIPVEVNVAADSGSTCKLQIIFAQGVTSYTFDSNESFNAGQSFIGNATFDLSGLPFSAGTIYFTRANICGSGSQFKGTLNYHNFSGSSSYYSNGSDGLPQFFFNASSQSINFQQPPYTNNMKTPDFKNWGLCINLTATASTTGYYYGVSYGTSTPYSDSDSLKDVFGIIPLSGSIVNECSYLTKAATSTPGTYSATAYLYDQDDNILAASATLNYTILSGGRINYPNQQQPPDAPKCGATDFELLGVDFGKGMCGLLRFVFVPSDASVDQFSTLGDYFAPKAPFSYFYQAKDILTNSNASSSTSTITSLTVSTPTSSPVHISTVIFSGQKLTEFVPSDTRALLRAVITGALSLSWLYMVIWEVRRLFHPSAGGAK